MDSKLNDGTVGGALLQLACLPLILAWAVVKGILIGVLAIVTLGLFHA